ncbi:IDEAL domain-containing protein [Mesobacillus foraminis]|uniref:IDEAL domain-containing protein n=1 Tax=Mesobacillus foraminis TaxID=279826 RepID=UPI001BE94C2E|nr:IDEAL domain-containing protein [Mesobacillus foraminis]MBT2757988.1 IDEAL domain-containing protein [Mesobacillus foraminis]
MDNDTFISSNDPAQSKSDSKLAESFLDKALHDFREAQIRKLIDQSLINQDKDEFLRLTEALKNL